MGVEIRPVERKDFKKAREFCRIGMNVDYYTDKPFEIYLYSKYFWYMELLRATQNIGAYIDGELAGVLLADMKGEKKAYKGISGKVFVKTAEMLMGIIFKGGANVYGETNQSMLNDFQKDNNADGELNFLAVEPKMNGKGIGTILLNELAKREKNKMIYLFTDSGCTYQFYDKRGFTRNGEKEIIMNLHDKDIPLTCFLYSKRL